MGRQIAIITARGGSRRIPGKNIRSFCGRPILLYSVQAAIDSGMFDTVMVSTDDPRIAETAVKAGASVPFLRSVETSGDYATTSDVLREVLDTYLARGESFDIACCLYPTAPFVTAERLRDAMRQFLADETADTLLPVVPFSFPPQRGLYIKEEGADTSPQPQKTVSPETAPHSSAPQGTMPQGAAPQGQARIVIADPDSYPRRSQDLERMYHDCGQFYLFRVDPFLKSGRLIGDHVRPMILDGLEVQDIDNETDWKLAELKYQLLHGTPKEK